LPLAVALWLALGATAQAAQDTITNYGYDAQGNLKTLTDPRGLVTTYDYDALNRAYRRIDPPATAGAAQPAETTGFDGLDQVLSVTDPRNLVTRYTVDGLGKLTQQQSPDSGTTASTYDESGLLKTRTDARGKVSTYSYDALDRVARISYPTGTASVFEYDGGAAPQAYDLGHLTQITDESGSTRLNYDAFGHVVKKTQITGSGTAAKTHVLNYAYNTKGQLATLTYPSGNAISYGYDLAGHIASLSLRQTSGGVVLTRTLISTITYTPFGAPTGWRWGNGAAYVRTIDLDGRVSQYPLGKIAAPATPGALTRTVHYDPASRIQDYSHADSAGSTTSALATSANQVFSFDDLNRLTGYSAAATGESYGYDLTGNRTLFSADTYVIDSLSNQLDSTYGASPAKTNLYDPAGNLTGDGTDAYSYSDRGRLATATVAGNTVTYAYNGLGQRVLKTGPATVVPTGTVRYRTTRADICSGNTTAAARS
jgi:YD repeat-containing protein